MRGILLAYLIFSGVYSGFAQNNFYKQFTGKILNQSIRMELIKAPSRDNIGFNLRGSYFPNPNETRIIALQGSLSQNGKIYLEEGYRKADENNPNKWIFIKTANLSGTYNASRGRIEGKWTSANGKQTTMFSFQEDYSNGSITADIIFNDLDYEDAQARFHYPQFKNHPFATKLNRFVQDSLLGNMSKQIHDFLDEYRTTRETGGMTDGFDNSNICYIIHNDNQLLSLEYYTSVYIGGAHGINKQRFYNLSLRSGNLIGLNELLNTGYEKSLLHLVEQTLRNDYKIPDNQSLSDFGFVLPNNKMYLSKNFYINRLSIGFFYNSYEIAPYSVGSQDIFIPFAKIKNLIKKEGLLGKYSSF